jgi:hypothetical protein
MYTVSQPVPFASKAHVPHSANAENSRGPKSRARLKQVIFKEPAKQINAATVTPMPAAATQRECNRPAPTTASNNAVAATASTANAVVAGAEVHGAKAKRQQAGALHN